MEYANNNNNNNNNLNRTEEAEEDEEQRRQRLYSAIIIIIVRKKRRRDNVGMKMIKRWKHKKYSKFTHASINDTVRSSPTPRNPFTTTIITTDYSTSPNRRGKRR